MFDVFYKKKMYNSVFTGQENAPEDRNCIISMFLTSFNIYFCLFMHCFMCRLCLRTAISLKQNLFFLVKTGWQPWTRVVGS